eukprot:365095-Chlamydomonas_euryale.AAC.4
MPATGHAHGTHACVPARHAARAHTFPTLVETNGVAPMNPSVPKISSLMPSMPAPLASDMKVVSCDMPHGRKAKRLRLKYRVRSRDRAVNVICHSQVGTVAACGVGVGVAAHGHSHCCGASLDSWLLSGRDHGIRFWAWLWVASGSDHGCGIAN